MSGYPKNLAVVVSTEFQQLQRCQNLALICEWRADFDGAKGKGFGKEGM